MSKPDTTATFANPERQSCGKFFFDCPEPSETVFEGVRCATCGAIVTAQCFEQVYEGKELA